MLVHSKELLIEPTYTLTVTTDPSYATCTLTVNGVQYHTKKLSGLKKNTVVTYLVSTVVTLPNNTSGTVDKTGTVTMDSNKSLRFVLNTTIGYSLDSDITTYGSPTITSDGIISGLSTSNRLRYSTSNMSQAIWNMHIKFKCTATTSTYQCLVGIGSNSSSAYGCRTLIDKNGYLYLTCYNGSQIYLSQETYSVVNKGWCIVDVSFTLNTSNTSFKKLVATLQRETDGYSTISLYNNSQVGISTKTTWNAYQFIGCQVYASSSTTWSRRYPATNCSIDLKEFYIISNGSHYIDNRTYTYSWIVTEL